MYRFIYCYFLKKLCYLQYSSAPCMLHNSLSKSSQNDDVAPCSMVLVFILTSVTWHLGLCALGKGPSLYLPTPTKTDLAGPLLASDICLNMSEFYAKIS